MGATYPSNLAELRDKAMKTRSLIAAYSPAIEPHFQTHRSFNVSTGGTVRFRLRQQLELSREGTFFSPTIVSPRKFIFASPDCVRALVKSAWSFKRRLHVAGQLSGSQLPLASAILERCSGKSKSVALLNTTGLDTMTDYNFVLCTAFPLHSFMQSSYEYFCQSDMIHPVGYLGRTRVRNLSRIHRI